MTRGLAIEAIVGIALVIVFAVWGLIVQPIRDEIKRRRRAAASLEEQARP